VDALLETSLAVAAAAVLVEGDRKMPSGHSERNVSTPYPTNRSLQIEVLPTSGARRAEGDDEMEGVGVGRRREGEVRRMRVVERRSWQESGRTR
jgi:hypothetical protein